MRHDRGHESLVVEARDHVLCKHEVRLLPFFRSKAVSKSLGELHCFPAVVLGKRRIGDNSVKLLDISGIHELRRLDGVFKCDLRIVDVVEEHVHFADRPGGWVAILAVQSDVAGVLARFLEVLLRLDQHAA